MKSFSTKLFLIMLMFAVQFAHANEEAYLCYDDFIQKVRDEKVLSVELGEYSSIYGTYEEHDKTVRFYTYHEDPNNDPLLLDLLKEKKVKIGVEKEKDNKFPMYEVISSMLIFIIPAMLILILLIVLIIKINKLNKLIKSKNT